MPISTTTPAKIIGSVANATHAANADHANNADNATAVTNGVYSTGSYLNPSWIASLDGSKIAGVVPEATHAASADSASTAATATTVTNGVYVTGSYADPAWLTSLAGSKVTGAVANATHATSADSATAATTATTATTAGSVLNGVYTTGAYADPAWLTALAASKLTGAISKAQAPATTVFGDQSNTFTTGTQDLSAATRTLPVKSVLSANAPPTCAANKELLIKTDAAAGQQLFICNATADGWNLVGDGTTAGSSVVNSIEAGDPSVTIGGTTSVPTVKVADGGISTAKLADGAVTGDEPAGDVVGEQGGLA